MVEIDALIVRNLKDMDAAATRTYSILQEQVGRGINNTVERWADEKGWRGKFELYGDDDDIWMAAPDWRGNNGDDPNDYKFWFVIRAADGKEFEGDPEGDAFWLTSLCGVGRATLGFRSAQDGYQFPKGRKWKAKVEPFVQRLTGIGFVYEDKTGQFFLPIAVDQEQLALGIENEDIGDALRPIVDALDRLVVAKPLFDDMIRAAQSKE